MIRLLGKKKIIIYSLILLAVILAGVLTAVLTKVSIPPLAQLRIALYTRNKPYAEVSVAVITPEGTDIRTYGHDGRMLEPSDRQYEIGAVTKTFTGALAARAVIRGEVSLSQDVSQFLPVSPGAYTPTLKDLVTHTSAYGPYMPEGGGKNGNPYSGINDFDVLYAMNGYKLTYEAPYIYSYSDFGTAAVGIMLGDLYREDFCTVLNDFVHLDLGLRNTTVCLDTPLKNGWKWLPNDAYIASFGLVSTIQDMAQYVKQYLNGGTDYLDLSIIPLKEINEDSSIGYFWAVSKSGLVGHGGETEHYSSQIYMDPVRGTAVIVLSNYGTDKYGSVRDIAEAIIRENG